MNIVNCTPHGVQIQKKGDLITLPKSGIIPRVSTVEVEADFIDGIPTVTQSTGNVEGLPASEAGVLFLVSGMVFSSTDRLDVVAPDTGKTAIRNEGGQIVAVTRLLVKGG